MTSTRSDHEQRLSDGPRAEDGAYAVRDDLDRNAAPDGAACDFIDETVTFWQKRTKRKLTREDGREIIENMTGFFRVLLEWDRAEREARNNEGQPAE